MSNWIKKTFVYVLLLIPLVGSAQHVFQGVVTDKSSRLPLPGVGVFLSGEKKRSTVTDKDGKFSIRKLDAGYYNVVVRSVGYVPEEIDVAIPYDGLVEFALQSTTNELQEVVVRQRRQQERLESTDVGVIELSPTTIKELPAIGGEKDVVKALQLTPGVKSISEGSAGMYVRGGSPDQNLYLLNNAVLYSSNHLFGFLSSFNSDAIGSVRLIKGGFPARYGGRLSSVLDVQTKVPNRQESKYYGSLGVISSSFTAELPIVTDKVSLLVSGRRTLVDALTGLNNALSDSPLPTYSFFDLNGKLYWQVSRKDVVQVFGYADADKIGLVNNTNGATNMQERVKMDQSWRNRVAGVQWEHTLKANLSNQLELNTSFYNLRLDNQQRDATNRYQNRFNAQIRDLTAQNTTFWDASPAYRLSAGVRLTRHNVEPGKLRYESNDILREDANLPNTRATEGGIFVENEVDVSKPLRVNVGLRQSWYRVGGKTYTLTEPRLNVRYKLGENTALKGAYARTLQPLHLLTNPGLGFPIDLWVSSTATIAPQRAGQVSLGLTHLTGAKGGNLTLSVEGYYKRMRGIITYRDGYSSDNFTEFSNNTQLSWENLVTRGNGESYGSEWFVEKTEGRWRGWVGYTLSWTKHQFDELNGGKPFYARYDRRHDVSVVNSYRINSRWSISANWVYGTGQAITIPVVAYSLPTIDWSTNQFESYTTPLFTQSERNAYRMKPFHRLDVAIRKQVTHRWGSGTWELNIYNAYNRRNPYYYYLGQDDYRGEGIDRRRIIKSVSLFPIIPSLSYTFTIK